MQIYESGRAVARAFEIATLLALASMAVLLFLILRRLVDVLMVLVPLAAAALATAIICWLIGLQLNFANIIALPLLLGIGVAFNIYFVVNWRNGISGPAADQHGARRPVQRPHHRLVLRQPRGLAAISAPPAWASCCWPESR